MAEYTKGELEVILFYDSITKQHRAEIYANVKYNPDGSIEDGDFYCGANVHSDIDEANANRIADCVNGCKDIENPMAVKDVVEALKALKSYIGVIYIDDDNPTVPTYTIDEEFFGLHRQVLSNLGGK